MMRRKTIILDELPVPEFPRFPKYMIQNMDNKWLITRYDSMTLYDHDINEPDYFEPFYKIRTMNSQDAMRHFDRKVGQWLSLGSLRDVNRISQVITMLSDEWWDIGMNWFKFIINDPDIWNLVIQGTKNQQLFKAIIQENMPMTNFLI